MKTHANFKSLQEGAKEDWQLIFSEFSRFANGLPDRVLAHLKLLEGDFGGFPVDRYTHSLQTATRALRDGRDDEYVVCALLHDIGDTLGTSNHPDIAVAILKPFVDAANLWMIQHHNIFQGYYFFHHIGMDRNMREQFRDHVHFERTAEFCELYDSPAFNAHAETLPISEFEPMLRRVFSKPVTSLYKTALEEAANERSRENQNLSGTKNIYQSYE